jgi:hypothetical protein
VQFLYVQDQNKRMIASSVSSTMISTLLLSCALMFRPSRPIILPLTSSDSMLNTDTQFSTCSNSLNSVNDDFLSFLLCR